jgi:MFS family permease
VAVSAAHLYSAEAIARGAELAALGDGAVCHTTDNGCTTGMGWGIGIGRFGAILAPLATGLLVDRGWHSVELYWVFAGTFLIAALALAALVPAARQTWAVREVS